MVLVAYISFHLTVLVLSVVAMSKFRTLRKPKPFRSSRPSSVIRHHPLTLFIGQLNGYPLKMLHRREGAVKVVQQPLPFQEGFRLPKAYDVVIQGFPVYEQDIACWRFNAVMQCM